MRREGNPPAFVGVAPVLVDQFHSDPAPLQARVISQPPTPVANAECR
jgi:hypothetical protein